MFYPRYKGEFADYSFLSQTVQTVIDTVTDMSGAVCRKSDRSVFKSIETYSIPPWTIDT